MAEGDLFTCDGCERLYLSAGEAEQIGYLSAGGAPASAGTCGNGVTVCDECSVILKRLLSKIALQEGGPNGG